MREFKVFNLPFDVERGFDDEPIQQWLLGARRLIKQESHLIHHGEPWLVVLVEAELIPSEDPFKRVPTQQAAAQRKVSGEQESARTRQRREKRRQYKRDAEAAIARLDERGRVLFDLLRSWRSTRAAEEGMPPYEFGSDLLFCEVAQRRPTDSASLKALDQCKPRFYKIAGEELVKVLQQFEAGEEQSWRRHADAEGEGS